jgi:transcriptional regulator with XRE-family HTH domain
MPSKTYTVDQIAKQLGVNISEIREKRKLIEAIIETRKVKKISQAKLAKKVGVTQGRIAQIESKIGTYNITFDILFNILRILGVEIKITTKKAA